MLPSRKKFGLPPSFFATEHHKPHSSHLDDLPWLHDVSAPHHQPHSEPRSVLLFQFYPLLPSYLTSSFHRTLPQVPPAATILHTLSLTQSVALAPPTCQFRKITTISKNSARVTTMFPAPLLHATITRYCNTFLHPQPPPPNWLSVYLFAFFQLCNSFDLSSIITRCSNNARTPHSQPVDPIGPPPISSLIAAFLDTSRHKIRKSFLWLAIWHDCMPVSITHPGK